MDVLLHNARGPFHGLPRTAGWGYPEPYTRDLMISMLGVAVSGDERLLGAMRRVLETLAAHQSPHGHMPSLVHDAEDRGSSDATPLFLLAAGIYRQVTGEKTFLQAAVKRSLTWMEYQSPSDRCLVGQQPTSDWRDEQWVLGSGLFVNSAHYSALRLLGDHRRADCLRREANGYTINAVRKDPDVPEGLVIRGKPYYALWAYKIYRSDRFDLLGNSFAILSGLASPARSARIVRWVERACSRMQQEGDLASDLPPNFFPFIRPEDGDWRPRYERFNNPGEYHNGGIWPFVCGFYVAALVAARKYRLAEKKLLTLTDLVRQARKESLPYGFNEWFKAQDARPRGQDWQTWSASMYLYAAYCVEQRRTPFFDVMRTA